MATPELDLADWEAVPLEWHDGYAFLAGALLGDEAVRDTYIMLRPREGTPGEVAQRAGGDAPGGYHRTPLAAGEPVWRHRATPWLLRSTTADFYLLKRYYERYGYHVMVPLPHRIAAGLRPLGSIYLRDRDHVYYFTDYGLVTMSGVQAADFHLIEAPAGKEHAGDPLASDGQHIFAGGLRIAGAQSRVRRTNHPAYLVIDHQVCWLNFGRIAPLNQKDGSPLSVDHPHGFRMLARRWGTDGHSIIVQAQQGSSTVYLYFYRIDNADLASFVVLNERYAKDAKRAYYLTGKSITYSGTFNLLRVSIPTFDEGGRVIATHEIEHEYMASDDQFVYVTGIKIRGAHAPSFRHLGFDYFRDENRAYYRGKPLDVDVASFVVAQVVPPGRDYGTLLVGDRHGPLHSNGVTSQAMADEWTPFFRAHPHLRDYWWHRAQAAPGHAELVEAPQTLHDAGSGFQVGKRVYFHGRPIDGLEAESFQVLSTVFCADANGLYLIPFHMPESRAPERFSTAAAERFHQFDEHYMSDGSTIFCQGVFFNLPKPIRGADAATFEICGHGWARDRRAVYYMGQVKKGLDPATTRIAGQYAYSDTLLLYAGTRLDVEFTPEEVSVPHPAFVMLGTRKLFYGRKPVSARRVDLPTLQFVDDRTARDQYRTYICDGLTGLKEASGA